MADPRFIPWAKPDFWGKEQEYVVEALTSTWISGGPFVDRFERDFAAFCGGGHVLACSNGTSALHMAYLALGIGAGDEVVVPGFAFLAVANIALQLGAEPVFAEVDPGTWCLCAGAVEAHISPRTKAIVPVHTYGNVCDMDGILELAGRRGIPVVEDTAEAFASRYGGRVAGTMGTIGTFSFQATKTITTGEGGMVVTADERLRDVMALYRSHGMLRKVFYWHELAGHNFRLTNMQAALGVAQLERIDTILAERRRVRELYESYLDAIDGVTRQQVTAKAEPVVWTMALKLDPRAYPQGRDSVMAQMRDAGIETRPGFRAPRQMPHIYRCPPLPISEDISRQVICLPTYPTLQNDEIQCICATLAGLRK
ncbi:DegT/DnrJ/EryC1/StrS family aminotransferase [Candidatus Fermentibacteria bacterium]|nr:DegT/DnrJ/EryC1/StrS family aminotransferase [Candidatus Fermentibacteria bacterium]